MSEKEKIINIAVIAHVDAGKSTLVDAFLRQSDVFRSNEEVIDCVMDSNDLERERGITIYSKNCSVIHDGVKINIVDTPGHADFSSEVERIIKTVDTVILLVDSSEGPMPQTRFVLSKALEMGLRPILLINKIDKKDARPQEVVDEVYELFLDLNATDEQLDFPILYGIAKQGIAQYDLDTPSDSIEPLFKTILKHCDVYPDMDDEPLQMQVSALAYDEYIGRLGIGRIYQGVLKAQEQIVVCDSFGNSRTKSTSQIFVYRGLSRVSVQEAHAGDIVVVAGIADISIGETLCEKDHEMPLPSIKIEEPTLSMNFIVNKSPFAGKSGKFVTSRNLKERLEKELEVNVGLKVEPTESGDCFKVSGRGELHISVLLEQMRREGYEVAVSKPEVILHKDENGKTVEPVEEVVAIAPEEYSGTIINKLNLRKGTMIDMVEENGYVRITYEAPTRGLLGYRSEFINDTRGEGTLVRRIKGYTPYKGEIQQRANGAMISTETGSAMTYALWNLQERGTLFISPQTEVYEGMIIGESARTVDMDVNPLKNKKLTAIRSSGNDEAMRLTPPRVMSLEEALEWINDDELVEIVPDCIRLRKKGLTPQDRRQFYRERVSAEEIE
ncbi:MULTISPECIES: translational GTPase TypA [Bacillota]|jgi:GTP-binding protein|uniref:Large ribosomal subunit assembly factor BipA n=1 Tax=Amedibacillus hominis TaxID=2897776 RepID=A0ABS9RD61_9FIRM|nr:MULTISPECIES: translational GTPase TypA [Bacillota]MCH4287599.1 translational GTPase TypA [Amedibacillus hominis]RGB48620.1 translational GTPase TypA [Absiella sp. AM22-9]RGB52683.1 translational GTPase TypA [Absiella sp. AM10-20]RGB67486.1 translational GTPase TypA [Absiella sp. AM09-45]RGB76829.1 translational GTPase TypA [Absiella sp. AM09-50]